MHTDFFREHTESPLNDTICRTIRLFDARHRYNTRSLYISAFLLINSRQPVFSNPSSLLCPSNKSGRNRLVRSTYFSLHETALNATINNKLLLSCLFLDLFILTMEPYIR